MYKHKSIPQAESEFIFKTEILTTIICPYLLYHVNYISSSWSFVFVIFCSRINAGICETNGVITIKTNKQNHLEKFYEYS